MQLTDAEIREILIRKKLEKKRRQKRRRRNTFIALLLIVLLIFLLVRFLGRRGSPDDSGSSYSGPTRGIIFIDPGHGGNDPGSDNGDERSEKDDTLKISLAVRDYLKGMGFQVEMSRSEDKTVDRTERGEMANAVNAQLFISIHRNKAANDGHGVEGFIPKKNAQESRLLGENIMHALARAGFTERSIRSGTLNDPDDDYEELAAASMPAALIEVGFLSSDEDNKLFDNNLSSNAKAMANAINETFMTLYEPEKAAEYEIVKKNAESISGKAAGSTKQAVNETSIVFDKMAEDDDIWIDPEA